MECTICGLAPCDLPDGIDPDDIFERVYGEWRCQVHTLNPPTLDPPRDGQ